MRIIFVLSVLFSLPSLGRSLKNFSDAKTFLPRLHEEDARTLYCGCRYTGKAIDLKSCNYQVHKDQKRARRLEWEHVVPAHAFGQAFVEWREGRADCVQKGRRFKGRKCAQKNPEFARMEADLHNLWPEVGEVNRLRSNYSMTEFGKFPPKGTISFGGCEARVHNRKFEPMSRAKGIVARTYLYMDQKYPGRGIISGKNRPLFEAWDKLYPVTDFECRRMKKIEALQGPNLVLKMRCERR